MRVLFVYPAHESLGIEYLSATLKRAGHVTQLAFDPVLFDDAFVFHTRLGQAFSYWRELVEQARRFRPDVISFGVLSPFHRWSVGLASLMKEATGARILFGGNHVSAAPLHVMRNPVVDFALVGEADVAIVTLVDALRDGHDLATVPNLVHRVGDEVVQNPLGSFISMDDLPWPDKDLFYSRSPHFRHGYTIATSRGCLMRCSFCSESFLSGLSDRGDVGYLRRRRVDDVIDELVWAKDKYKFNHVRFYDTILTHSRSWFAEFAEAYASRVGLPYWCMTYPTLLDRPTVQALEDSGCTEIQMGVQTFYESTRQEVFNRDDSNESVARAIDLLRDSKILTSVDNILGVPDQTEGEILDTVDFYAEHPIDRVKMYWLTYFPGTTILDVAMAKGALTEDENEELHADPTMRSTEVNSPEDQPALNRLFAYAVLSPFLPKSLLPVIRKQRLYRFFPKLETEFLATAMYQLKQGGGGMAHLEKRIIERYARYGVSVAANRVAGLFDVESDDGP